MATLNVAVLVKDILDPELPPSRFRLDRAALRPEAGLGPSIPGPFERSALEMAMKLKDSAGARVTAISVGEPGSTDGLRKALAVKADEAVRVSIPGAAELEPMVTATLLAAAIGRLSGVNLVVAGRQAGDWDQGQVGYLLAALLGWPCIGLARQATLEGEHLQVRHDHAGGQEVVAVTLPAVVTVTNDDELLLRMARVNDLMAAQRRPITDWPAAELVADLEGRRGLEVEDIWIPERNSVCEFIEGEDAAEKAANTARRLQEMKLL